MKDKILIREQKWISEYLILVLNRVPRQIRTDYYDNVKSFKKVKDPSISRFLYGEVGSGKSVMACNLFVQFLHQKHMNGTYFPNMTYHFLGVSELFFELKKTYAEKMYQEAVVLERYMKCDILVLDDIGVKSANEWTVENLYLIINHRYNHNLPTIMTSNVSLKELADLLNDDRIIRRIEQTYRISKKLHWSKS